MSLDPAYYHDLAILQREHRTVFANAWIFAGTTDELAVPGDYILRHIAGREIIIRNSDERIRAFVNVCSHRQSRILEQARGNCRMVCPYHGWSYDDEGVPVAIPESENFPAISAQRRSFALQQLEVEHAGKFIFVRSRAGGPGLREFLGEAWDFICAISAGMGDRLDAWEVAFDANWKIIIENAVESYHVPVVHPQTFMSSGQFSTRDEDVSDGQFIPAGHSQRIAMADPDWLHRWRAFAEALGDWPLAFDRYTHQAIFPNLTVTSFMGYLFHVQSFTPMCPGETMLSSSFYSIDSKRLSEEGASIMRTISDEAVKFTRKVIEEDRRACALVQDGTRYASRSPVIGHDVERRVEHFQTAYLAALGKKLDSDGTLSMSGRIS